MFMGIFINHSLYVSYSSFSNMGPECYKLLPLNPWRLYQGHIMWCFSATWPSLLGGFGTIYHDKKKPLATYDLLPQKG
jgi:hypothetical protein